MLFRFVTHFVLPPATCLLLLCTAAVQAQVQAQALASSQFENCGLQIEPPQDCPDCQGEAVFQVEDHWHGLAQCSRDLRDAWARFGPEQRLDLPGQPRLADFARDQILSEMTSPDVRFLHAADGRPLSFAQAFDADLRPRGALSGVVLINDRGAAYNGMGQTGMAYFLLQFAAQAGQGGYEQAGTDAAFYRLLGRAALASVLMPATEGGLATSSGCALAPALRCSWYHSVTRRDLAGAAGGTLNQMLHVLRDMAQIDQLARRQGWTLDLDLPGAIEAGLNQLFLSGGYQGPGTGPDLADFNSGGRNNPADIAWAYYGFNTLAASPGQQGGQVGIQTGIQTGGRGYFLKNPAKNCSYHLHDVELLQAVFDSARNAGIAEQARAAAAGTGAAARTLAGFIAALGLVRSKDERSGGDRLEGDDLPPQIRCSDASRAKIADLVTDLAD